MDQQLIEVLPAEVAQIAKNVSVEKRNEVQSVLNHVFNGVSKMREQLEMVVVQDENDKTNMKLARTIRLGARKERLDAEKTFDVKRAEVQSQMLSYKTEDQLWLKAKQTMQIMTKEIEEIARWKEETRERFEAEQKELKARQRMLQISKVAPEIPRAEYENMSDESFDILYAGIEKQYNDRIEAERKAEEQRIAKEKAEEERRARFEKRSKELAIYWATMTTYKNSSTFNYTDASEEEYNKFLQSAIDDKKRQEQEIEQKKIENERLKAEAEAKEKQLAEERLKAEAERKALEEKVRKEKVVAEAKLKAEIEAKEKLEAELKAKAEAEQKAKREAEVKEASELKAKQDAEKKAKATPDKAKLNDFAKMLDELALPELKSEEANKVLSDVKTLLAKVSNFIREKINN